MYDDICPYVCTTLKLCEHTTLMAYNNMELGTTEVDLAWRRGWGWCFLWAGTRTCPSRTSSQPLEGTPVVSITCMHAHKNRKMIVGDIFDHRSAVFVCSRAREETGFLPRASPNEPLIRKLSLPWYECLNMLLCIAPIPARKWLHERIYIEIYKERAEVIRFEKVWCFKFLERKLGRFLWAG